MSIIALVICLLVLSYMILAAAGVFRRRILAAFTWIGISILSALGIYGLAHVLQDFLPRLYDLATPAWILVAVATLAIGFAKVLGRPSKTESAQQVAP